MTESSELTPEQRENLVAYLDGELDETAAHEIENLLSQSVEVRKEVEELTQAWELLEVLPVAQASDEFTDRTLSTIKAVETEQAPRRHVWQSRLRSTALYGGWAAALLLAAGIGFAVTNRWVKTEADQLVGQLPVIENLDVYTEIDSVEFLNSLKESGLFNGSPEEDQ